MSTGDPESTRVEYVLRENADGTVDLTWEKNVLYLPINIALTIHVFNRLIISFGRFPCLESHLMYPTNQKHFVWI